MALGRDRDGSGRVARNGVADVRPPLEEHESVSPGKFNAKVGRPNCVCIRCTLLIHLVYDAGMRTNIQLDDALLAEAAKYTATRSKKGLVHEALSLYVTTKREERRRMTYRERLQRVRAKTSKVRGCGDAHELVRQDRAR